MENSMKRIIYKAPDEWRNGLIEWNSNGRATEVGHETSF